jgi:hypothetical protein
MAFTKVSCVRASMLRKMDTSQVPIRGIGQRPLHYLIRVRLDPTLCERCKYLVCREHTCIFAVRVLSSAVRHPSVASDSTTAYKAEETRYDGTLAGERTRRPQLLRASGDGCLLRAKLVGLVR